MHRPPAVWPPDSRLAWREGLVNVVVSVHPRCSCTMATLSQLETLVARHPASLKIHCLFLQPADALPEWHETPIWRAALQLQDADCRVDVNAVEANRFRAATSGQAAVYRPDGTLAFFGGLTPGRGIAGPSAGIDVIERLIVENAAVSTDASPASGSSPVFGCPLHRSPPSSSEGLQ